MIEQESYFVETKSPSTFTQNSSSAIARSSFLAHVRHELRTPLNAILGYSEMLQEEADEGGQLGFIPDLTQINSKARLLLRLIGSYLETSRAEYDLPSIKADFLDLLSQVQGCNSRLLSEAKSLGFDSYLADLEQIAVAGRRLDGLINELLITSRFNALI